MTDVENTQENNDLPNELELLKGRADRLGVKYHPNIGVDALREKVQKAMNLDKEIKDEKMDAREKHAQGKTLSKAEIASIERENLQREANRLVRVEIACMNPNKREWQGEIFTVANGKIGTIKKFVPFNVPFHVPQAILNMIKERQCQIFETAKDSRGNKTRKGKLIKEFAINELKPLTERELRDLAAAQAAAGTINR